MEIRARYTLIGLFVLAVIAAGVGFIYWLYNTGGLAERTAYQVLFGGPVSGLSRGSAVLFNGLQVGEVTGLSLVADDPGSVIARISIDARTPIRTDTRVGMDFRGLTGTATVALAGGTPAAPRLAGNDENPPLLRADDARIKDMTQSARDVLARLDTILSDNAEPLKSAIANINTFSEALARNADKIDGIAEGLQRLTGGGPKIAKTTVDLPAPTGFPPIEKLPEGQLAIPSPTTVISLDNQRIVVRTPSGEIQGYEDVLWADSVPLVVAARLTQGFENAGYPRVGSDSAGISSDFQLLVDIRYFVIDTTEAPTAKVAFMAKVLDADGKVVDARLFEASTPLAAPDRSADAAAALGTAFGQAATDLIVWSLGTMAEAETGGAEEDLPPLDDNAAPSPDVEAPPPPPGPPPGAPAPTGQ